MRLPKKTLIAAFHDLLMASISLPLALYLRLSDDLFNVPMQFLAVDCLIFIACFACFALIFRLPKEVWRYISINELSTIIKVSVSSIITAYLIMFLYNRLEGVPRSVPILHLLILLFLLSSTRLLYRKIRENNKGNAGSQPKINVALIGANDHTEGFIRTVQRRRDIQYNVVAIIDNNEARAGRNIRGVPIYSSLAQLTQILQRLEKDNKKPQRLILSEQFLDADIVQSLFAVCETQGIALARLPRPAELQEGVAKQDIRPIVIEDLLNRPQNQHDDNSMHKLIRGRVILVTGAGGSIGSELVRQIASYNPNRLIVIDNSEHNLYQIDRELATSYGQIERISIIADVRDRKRIQQIMAENNPEIVFHAAALKHVPLAELNPEETIITNVFGTRNVAMAAALEGVEVFVLVSTDKAVHPANVMGASKRLAELICADVASIAPELKMTIVRFGNVLGSTGSVVPLFQEQLKLGGPITVTHPEMERYFMTIREASGLVIQAAAQAKQGIALYILDMGKPVRILSLAEQMIRLAGLIPNKDVHIRFTGLRAGEKLREELVYSKEPLSPTEHAKIMRAKLHTGNLPSKNMLEALEEACYAFNSDMVVRILQDLVPEYAQS
jgi:O-antigen biosynthesis protein WbqV